MVAAVQRDYREANLPPAEAALMAACDKLTRTPWEMSADDCDELRRHGWDDRAIHDAFQVASYFNYINRVADGLGINLEEFMPPEPPGWKAARPE